METIICLVRHGQTDWNKLKLIQGTKDNPLNETGIKQAQIASLNIKKLNITFDTLVSSPLKRAYQTMETIKNTLNINKPIYVMKNFQEREFGDLEGKYVCDESYRLMDSNTVRGLESLQDLQIRSINALKEIHNKFKGQNILVTTHSQIIKGILTKIIPDFDFKFVILNSSLNLFRVTDDKIECIECNIH